MITPRRRRAGRRQLRLFPCWRDAGLRRQNAAWSLPMELPMPLRGFPAAVLLAASVFSARADDTAALQGAWQLQSGEFLDGEGARIDYARQKLAGTKLLADGRFAFTTTQGGKFWAGGSGTYTAGAGRYVESPSGGLLPAGKWRPL